MFQVSSLRALTANGLRAVAVCLAVGAGMTSAAAEYDRSLGQADWQLPAPGQGLQGYRAQDHRAQDHRAQAASRREIVDFSGAHAPGTIIVRTAERKLYLVLENGKALRYGVGVARPGLEWSGVQTVTMKREWPDWRPPADMLKRRPDLPRFMKGGEANPLGARAMYLGSSLYRIHGSNEPDSIGQAVSSGCIRMLNEDVIDLYSRVRLGARVIVI